VQAETIAEA